MDTVAETVAENIVPDYNISLNPGKWSRKKRNIKPSIMARVFQECNYSCVVCGLSTLPDLPRDSHGRVLAFKRDKHGTLHGSGHRLTIDHLVPKALRSANHYPNLIVLCDDCNNRKADKLPRAWLKTLSVELQVSLLDKVIFAETYHAIVSEPNERERDLIAQGQDFRKGRTKNPLPLWSIP